MSIYFNGKKRVSPGVFSTVDDREMLPVRAGTGSVVALVGYADGGKPFEPIRVRSYAEAAAAVKGGDLLLAAAAALKPPVEANGPSMVVLIRVSNATQASLTLNDADGNPSLLLRSQDYGRQANLTRVRLEAGGLRGYRVSSGWRNDVYSADNVGRSVLLVKYAGAGAATMEVTPTALSLSVDGTVVETIGFAEYGTVGDVADRLQAVADFSAEVLENSRQHASAYALDGYSGPVTAGGVLVTAHLQALIDWFNSASDPLVQAERAAGATHAPAVTGWVYLTGAADGTTNTADWQRALDVLTGEDVQWVVPVTADPAVHSLALTHVRFMSEAANRERRVVCGMASGTTDDAAIEYASSLNSDRAALVHLGYYDYDASGKLVLLPPYILASMIAGSLAGLPVGESLTNKSLQIRGLERRLRNPTDTDRLIEGGVLCVDFDGTRYRVVRAISTWLTDALYNRVELSTGVALDFAARAVREAIQPLIGSRASPSTLTLAVSRADSVLRDLSRPEPIGPGVLVGDKANPPYRNIVASIDGDALSLSFEGSPVIPLNYGTVTVRAVPYRGTASV